MFTLFSFFLSFSFHYYSSFLTFSVFFLILVVFTSFIFRMFVSFTFRTISILSIFHFIFLLNILVLFSLCARLNWQCVCQFLSANFPLYCIVLRMAAHIRPLGRSSMISKTTEMNWCRMWLGRPYTRSFTVSHWRRQLKRFEVQTAANFRHKKDVFKITTLPKFCPKFCIFR